MFNTNKICDELQRRFDLTVIRTKFGEYGIKPSVNINSDEAELDLEELIVED